MKREEKGIMVASGKSPKRNAAPTFDITDEQTASNSAKHDLCEERLTVNSSFASSFISSF